MTTFMKQVQGGRRKIKKIEKQTQTSKDSLLATVRSIARGRVKEKNRQTGTGRSQSAPGGQHRQEIYKSRPSVSRSDSRRQYWSDESR